MENESAVFEALQKIENKALRDYVAKNNIKHEMQNLLKAFFNPSRVHLPENPYPEITKRFRQIEVRYFLFFSSSISK